MAKTVRRTRNSSSAKTPAAKKKAAKKRVAKKRSAKKIKSSGAARKATTSALPEPEAHAGDTGAVMVPGGLTIPNATPGNTISIRMYRGLLGDFFLVRHNIGDRSFKMLIDCGVLQCIGSADKKPSTYRGKQRIVAGVADLIRDTDAELDLVVATHEHFDHLSGYIHASEAFKDLKIKKVWMAWTEDRADTIANGYRNKKKKSLTALAALVQNPALAATNEMQAVSNLLQFYGDINAIASNRMGVAALARDGKLAGNASCEAVLDWLRKRAGAGNVSFLKPGEVVHWGLDDAFRAYVLGPPREHDDLLRKLDPSKGNSKEVYLTRGAEVETVHGLAAIHGSGSGHLNFDDQPFTAQHRRFYDSKTKPRKKQAAEWKDDPIVRLYRAKQPFHRSIDDEWLGSAENLALKIDGDVNNTSLALALELTDKRVLLFPGDAQVGNWLSWGEQTYPVDDTHDSAQLMIEDILARTIFYKVGHHASHNATMRERGLELMNHASLCAMVPVVEETAREQTTKKTPQGWAMPYGDLYKRLIERTQGRLIRGDGDIRNETSKFVGSIFKLSYGPDFAASDPLWVELGL